MRRADRYRLAFAEDRFRDRNDLAITAIVAVGFNIAETLPTNCRFAHSDQTSAVAAHHPQRIITMTDDPVPADAYDASGCGAAHAPIQIGRSCRLSDRRGRMLRECEMNMSNLTPIASTHSNSGSRLSAAS